MFSIQIELHFFKIALQAWHCQLVIFCFTFSPTISLHKGATRGGAKGAEVAPPLAKAKFRKNIKYWLVLIFLCVSDMKLRNFCQFMVLKIDYVTVKPQKSHIRRHFYDIINITSLK